MDGTKTKMGDGIGVTKDTVSRGKQFEDQVRTAFETVPNTTVTRLIDPQNGFCGVRNVCDFIIYHYPHQYFIECKSCHGNTLPFSNITEAQWRGMLEMSKTVGVIAGVVVWFIDCDNTMFIPIQNLQRLKELGEKSVNIRHIEKLQGDYYIIPAKKKRILFEYDFADFLGGD